MLSSGLGCGWSILGLHGSGEGAGPYGYADGSGYGDGDADAIGGGVSTHEADVEHMFDNGPGSYMERLLLLSEPNSLDSLLINTLVRVKPC